MHTFGQVTFFLQPVTAFEAEPEDLIILFFNQRG
jgi:hypothetical protein